MGEATADKNPKIFVAEDNAADLYLVRLALEQHGVAADLHAAAHGDHAMKLLDGFSRVDRPDLILMDLNLPGIGGLDILTRLREATDYNDVPIVVMTSSSAASDRQAAERLGVHHYFRKPTHLNEFLELGAIIKQLLPSQQSHQ